MQKVGCTAPLWPLTPRFSRVSQPALPAPQKRIAELQPEKEIIGCVLKMMDAKRHWHDFGGYRIFRTPPYDHHILDPSFFVPRNPPWAALLAAGLALGAAND